MARPKLPVSKVDIHTKLSLDAKRVLYTRASSCGMGIGEFLDTMIHGLSHLPKLDRRLAPGSLTVHLTK